MCSQAVSEIEALAELSEKLGRDPLLVQAASGNTSVKVDGRLWIKASGKWLADARQETVFTCVDFPDALQEGAPANSDRLKPSIETAMHAALPHKVVVHVHSVNTIAWAVRRDGPEQLADRLGNLDWHWIPHVPSGQPLAREISKALSCAPDSNIFVLANHGLVVCGRCCEEAEALLREVEDRVAIAPRSAPRPPARDLEHLACGAHWRLPPAPELHALGTDRLSRSILAGGVLYPCQAIFLAPSLAIVRRQDEIADAVGCYRDEYRAGPPFLIVEESGVILSQAITRAECEMLMGLMEVVQRLEDPESIRYLTASELATVLNADAYGYRALVEATPSHWV